MRQQPRRSDQRQADDRRHGTPPRAPYGAGKPANLAHRPPKRPRRRGWLLMLVLIGAMAGFGWLGARSYHTEPALAAPDPAPAATTAATAPAPAQPPAPLNPFRNNPLFLLLVGTDVDVTAGRTDTMILLAADFDRQAVALLSIPRDTRVFMSGVREEKINAAFPVGGSTLCCQAVANLVQKPIHHFLHCDLKAFKEAVDALGGVTVDVEKRMSYRDRAQHLRIDLQPGPQRLDGEHAMQYVRFRKDKLGDLGRIQRQQTFLKAVAKEMCRTETLPKLPGVVQAVNAHLETTMSLPQMLYLANLLAKVGPERLVTGQLPGEAHYLDGISYFLASPRATTAIDDLLATAPGADDDAVATEVSAGLAPAVTIYNGSDRLGLERLVAESLVAEGITARAAPTPTSAAVQESRVYAVSLDDYETAARFGARLGVTASSNPAPPNYAPLAAEAGHPQLVLVLGSDFQPPR